MAEVEGEGEPERGDELDRQRDDQNQLEHAHDVARLERAALGMRDQARAQPQASPGEEAEQGGAAHDPEAPDLEHGQDQHLSERGPVVCRVDRDQAGHADRGGGGGTMR